MAILTGIYLKLYHSQVKTFLKMNPQDIDAANEFNRLHDEAFHIINIALHLEESEKFAEVCKPSG